MAVILIDGSYAVRRREHPAPRDADGIPVLAAPGDPEGPWPGASHETSFNSWSLRLDPRAWPLREGDLIIGGGHTFVVQGRPSLFRNNASAALDYISVAATLSPEELA